MRTATRLLGYAIAAATVALAQPAAADVKAGVDDWNRGDYTKAVAEWRPAAIAGDALAQFNLGQAYKLGRGVPADLDLAESWYAKAAAQGLPEAEANYGLALFQNNKRAQALPWLEKAVARGEPRAQLVLGTMLYNGDAVERDWPRAYALMVRASSSGLSQASRVLAQMDQYIPEDARRQGLVLARQYETDAQRAVITPDNDDRPAQVAIRGGEAPPPVSVAPQRPRHEAPPVKAAADAPAKPAPPPRAIAGRGWRLQFGAFRDQGNAQRLWDQLRTRVPGMGKLQPYFVRSGALTRLQAGPLSSSAEATRMCAAVKPTGNPCVPVAP